MRVAISTSVIQRGRSGIAQYLFALLRGIVSAPSGHEFELLVLQEDLPLFDFLNGQMRILPVPESFRPPVRNILWHQTQLASLARRRGWDVLHIPSYRRLLWARPCPLVATIHDLAPFRLAGKYDWKRMLYGRLFVTRLARRQDRIIAVSQSTAADVRTFFRVPASRIRVIHNGVEHTRFHPGREAPAPAALLHEFGLSKPFFLYIARLEHPGKNHVRLISAFNAFKRATGSDWQLVFGGSDWHGAEAIHAAIKASPFSADIRSLGFIPDQRLPDFYRLAKAFLYPSLFEGFGMPPIEAMACGCPVLCSDRGSLGEVVGRAALITNPEDEQAMAGDLRRLAQDPTLRAELARTGLEHARGFDWNVTAAETLRVYEQAVGRQMTIRPVPACST
jgi:glycosyltransferase involved in cell wall biosynthesis